MRRDVAFRYAHTTAKLNRSVASDPTTFRDSTQIVLPPRVAAGVREDLRARFRLTVDERDESVRIIASPLHRIRERTSVSERFSVNEPPKFS